MKAKLQGWRRLPAPERWRFLLLLVGLPVVSFSLATVGYRRTRSTVELFSPRAGAREPSRGERVTAERLAQLTALAGTHGPVNASCLRQALLVYLLLRRKGLDPKLRIGARRQAGVFDAHAWVELDGHALGQDELQHRPFREPAA